MLLKAFRRQVRKVDSVVCPLGLQWCSCNPIPAKRKNDIKLLILETEQEQPHIKPSPQTLSKG